MHKKKWIYTLCLLIALLGVLAWPALAAPPIPAAFWGVLTIDGTPASDGMVVKALINGQEYASATVFTDSGQPGLYLISVPGDDPDTSGVIEGGVVLQNKLIIRMDKSLSAQGDNRGVRQSLVSLFWLQRNLNSSRLRLVYL